MTRPFGSVPDSDPVDLVRSMEHVGLAVPPEVGRRAAGALLEQARALLAHAHVRTSEKPYGRAWFDARAARRRLHRAAAAPAENLDELAAIVDELTCVGSAMRSKPWGSRA